MNTRRLVAPEPGRERDWNLAAQLTGRSIPYSMEKVLGGRPSINVMIWARK
jgi:choline dehydrogenase